MIKNGNNGLITRIDLCTISVPFTTPEESATLSRLGFDNVLVRVETDEGAVGWGEANGASGAPVKTVLALMEEMQQFVLGGSVFETGRMRNKLVLVCRLANMRRLAHLGIAAFDMACWDAAGKLLNKPIHALIGGAVREEVDFYAYPLVKSPMAVAEDAARMVGKGFSVVYLKVGMGDASDLETVRLVREAVGTGPRIRVDANEAWDMGTARRMSVKLEQYDIEFIEQPIDARDVIGMRELRRTTRIPIAANQGMWSLAEVMQVIRLEACDVVVTGPYWIGGLMPLQTVASACAESGIGFGLHAPPATSIGTAAGLHALATVPALLDGNQTYLYHLAEDVSDGLGDPAAPRLQIPKKPGLGIEIDEKRIKAMSQRYEADGGFLQHSALETLSH